MALEETIVAFHTATIFFLFMVEFCLESPNPHISGNGGAGHFNEDKPPASFAVASSLSSSYLRADKGLHPLESK